MTNKEAIEVIQSVRKQYIPRTVFDKANEALDLAIKALEDRPTGEWIMNKISARGRNYTCTACEKVSRNKFHYCPNCGARMEVEND